MTMTVPDERAVSSEREWVNPLELLTRLRESGYVTGPVSQHIVFDPTVNGRHCDYRIMRSSKHDGTYLFHLELIGKVLNPLLNRTSTRRGRENDAAPVRYRVGMMRCANVFGVMDTPWGRRGFCQRERLCLPVVCEYEA